MPLSLQVTAKYRYKNNHHSPPTLCFFLKFFSRLATKPNNSCSRKWKRWWSAQQQPCAPSPLAVVPLGGVGVRAGEDEVPAVDVDEQGTREMSSRRVCLLQESAEVGSSNSSWIMWHQSSLCHLFFLFRPKFLHRDAKNTNARKWQIRKCNFFRRRRNVWKRQDIYALQAINCNLDQFFSMRQPPNKKTCKLRR